MADLVVCFPKDPPPFEDSTTYQEPLPVGPYGPERDRSAYALTAEVEGLGAPAKLILLLLESRCTSIERQCSPDWPWLMKKSALRRTCLAKALAELRSRGLVRVVRSGSRRDRDSTLYEVALPVDGLDGPVFEPLTSTKRTSTPSLTSAEPFFEPLTSAKRTSTPSLTSATRTSTPLTSAKRTSTPSLTSATRTSKSTYVRTEDLKEEEEEVLAIPADDPTTTVVVDDVNAAIEPSPPSTDVPEAGDLRSDPTTVPQLKLIADICGELGVPAVAPVTRREAIPVIADLLARRDGSRAAARLEAKGQGRRQKGAAVDRAVYASAAQCDGCETVQYPEPGGRCPACGESMRQWERPAG